MMALPEIQSLAKINQSQTPELRLILQSSIPVQGILEAEAIYKELKIFLLTFSPRITVNAQIVKILEPCCKERTKTDEVTKTTTIF